MSFAVMHGEPTKAQLYLDGILDELVAETGREDDRYSYAKLLFKCMKDNPDDVRQIDGNTGEVETNRVVLERSVRTALALQDAGVKPGEVVIGISRNHVETSATYFGPIFAGILPLHLPIFLTVYELNHYIKLSDPVFIFTGMDSFETVKRSVAETGSPARVVVFGSEDVPGYQKFSEFISRSDSLQTFRPVDTEKDSAAILVSTSGSTGFPKVAVISSLGLVAQTGILWGKLDAFPTPTRLVLVLANAYWISYSIFTGAAISYRCALLYTSGNVTVDHLRTLFRKYRPTYFTTTTLLAQGIVNSPGGQPDDLSSLDFLLLGGSAIPEKLLTLLKPMLSPRCRLRTGYGVTEAHGGVASSKYPEPTISIGSVINIFKHKIIDEQGNTLGINQPGELCLKNDCFKLLGYLKDEATYKEAFTEDGYFRTGDKVYKKEDGELVFLERIKFLIKYKTEHVYPSELEDVICKVEGVASAAVCEAEKGPAALVVARPGFKPSAQEIHRTVNSTLSDAKRLRGGITFVTSIPMNGNGKADRQKLKLILKSIDESMMVYEN